MPDLYLDTETYCETPIKWGSSRYAEDAEVMLLSWALDDGPVSVWDVTDDPGMPDALQSAAMDDSTLVWFQNGDKFDWPVLEHALPWLAMAVPIERRRDTMVQAYAHSLPGNLEMMADALGVEADKRKLKEGRRLIRLFCMPQKTGPHPRATRLTHPEDWALFKEYAGQDIVAMRECHRRMPSWNMRDKQLKLWAIDQRINARGIQMDVELAEAAVRASEKAKTRLAARTRELTDDAVQSATQRDNMLAWILEAHGVDLPDMQAPTLDRRLKDDNLPPELRELLAVRLEATTTSVAKYGTLLHGVNRDGRLRGTMQFRGAGRTGRDAHRLFQPGNMPRPDMPADEILWAIELLKLDAAHLVYDNVMRVCSNAIRGTIIAGPGKKLVVDDLANIEGRFAAWIAGEEWKLDAFRAYDAGTGPDLYIRSYSSSFNVPPESIDKKTVEGNAKRQIGKVCLAGGTQVLTDQGLVAIENVTRAMKVWDGLTWVCHEGVICNGTKEVITYEGLTATPDHMVWVYGENEPVPFEQAAAGRQRIVESGSDRRPIRVVGCDVPDSALHPKVERPLRSRSMYRVRHRAVDFGRQLVERYEHSMLALWAQTSNSDLALATVRGSQAAVHQPQRPRLDELRRSRHPILFWFGDRSGPLHDRNVRFAEALVGSRSEGQQRALRARQPAVGNTKPERSQHPPGTSRQLVQREVALRKERHLPLSESRDEPRRDHVASMACSLHEAQELARDRRKTLVYDIVNAGPRHRFTANGKLVANCELMFQYAGGVGAWITGAATYGIDLAQMTEQVFDTLPEWARDEAESFMLWLYEDAAAKYKRDMDDGDPEAKGRYERRCLKARFGLAEKTFICCDAIKRLWRRAHPAISTIWKDLENAVQSAIGNPGEQFNCRRLKVRRDGAWLRIGLPSGRVLCYPHPMWDGETTRPDGTKKQWPGFSYMGIDQYTKQWQRIGSYGGKLFENVVQAGSCDQLLETMPAVEDAGFGIVLRVHDEFVCEAPADRDDLNPALLGRLMCSDLGWNAGLPLAAAGYEGPRYRKD